MNTTKLTMKEIKKHEGNMEEPSLYISTYGKYNKGSLDGMWINLNSFDEYEDFVEFVNRFHNDEKNAEFMVQDFDNIPKSFYRESGLPTKFQFDTLKEYANMNETEKEAYELYSEYMMDEIDIEKFRNNYIGYYENEPDYAEEIAREIYSIPKGLEWYINYEMMLRDWELNGDIISIDGHIFYGR